MAGGARPADPRAPVRAPAQGWLSFIVQGEGIQPIPYTTDNQERLRMTIERSELGVVRGHPQMYYITPQWAEVLASGKGVKPLPLYYVKEGEDLLKMHYCDNQDAVTKAIKESRLGLVPGQTQVFYVTKAQATALEKAGFTFALSYLYFVVEGDSPLDIWCCDKQELVSRAIRDSNLGPVPGAAPNVFFVRRGWKASLDEAGTRLLKLLVLFPGDDWRLKSRSGNDQRLIREAIRESGLGRVPDGVTDTYYVSPASKDRLEKADCDYTRHYCMWDNPRGGDSYLADSAQNRLVAEAAMNSEINSHGRFKDLGLIYYKLSPKLHERIVREVPGVWNVSAKVRANGATLAAAAAAAKANESSCSIQ